MIKKAIFPVAGLGTRFFPVTKSLPKEMLPICDKPIIQYIIEEAIDSGINEIIFVTGKGKRAIEDYFDPDPHFLMSLDRMKKYKSIDILKSIENKVKIAYVRQPEPKGDGDAVLRASHCIDKKEDFAVLFGDDIIDSSNPALGKLIKVYNKTKSSVIAVEEVEDVSKYGIIGFNPDAVFKDFIMVNSLIEKPAAEDSPSNIGIIGKYICSNKILKALRGYKIKQGEELRLINGFTELLKKNERIFAKIIEGERYDTGDKLGLIKANIVYAMKDKDINNNLKKFIKERII